MKKSFLLVRKGGMMDASEFEWKLQKLVHEANAAGIQIDDVFKTLSGQTLIAETILRLEIEQAYKERFK